MVNLSTVKEKKESILKIAALRGASNIRVFGSVARGDNTSTSDIDFLVQLDPNRNAFDLGGLLMDLQDLFECRVDITTDEGLNPLIKDTVLKEVVPL